MMNTTEGNQNDSPQSASCKQRTARTILRYWNNFDPQKRRTGRIRARQTACGPMARLWRAMQNTERVLVMTRGLREPRATLLGNLVAFDRYWNLILSHVTECSVEVNPSTYVGNARPGRSKRRRQQRLASFFKQYGHALDPSLSGNLRAIRKQWYEQRRRASEPMEVGQLIPSLDATDQGCSDASKSDNAVENSSKEHLETGVIHPPNCSSGASNSYLFSQLVQTWKQNAAPSQPIGQNRWKTSLIHHAQLFIRGANVVHVSFPISNPISVSENN